MENSFVMEIYVLPIQNFDFIKVIEYQNKAEEIKKRGSFGTQIQ
jgi:hypothetical protein